VPAEIYDWPAIGRFHNRDVELARLEAWWSDDTSPEPLTLWGRRRVGKSWLFRRLAHGKRAFIHVADRLSAGVQFDRVSKDLEPVLGRRPRIDDIGDLFTAFYRLARDTKTLVVIDEFPYLLGTTAAEQRAALTAVQGVMERERDGSQIKLLLAGSTIATMRDLLQEQNPLHGRLVSYPVSPLDFVHARALMGPSRSAQGPQAEIAHFGIAGGMPRYLNALHGEDLLAAVRDQVLDPGGALFNEPRAVLASELREPAMYFSILSSLAVKPGQTAEIAADLRIHTRDLGPYLQALESLQLVDRYEPVGTKPGARGSTRWRCNDDFVRFWFRFVQPFQGELESGADPAAFLRKRVVPALPEHLSLTFERVLVDWMRRRHGSAAPMVGPWWGGALHGLRARKERFSEEIDVVVLDGRTVLAVAEAKWTNKAMPATVLTDLDDYKLPALTQAGLRVSGAEIVLAAKSGFSDGLREAAASRANVHLVTVEEMFA
jgi:AAA+ ATPase superfamily predicted ATPase